MKNLPIGKQDIKTLIEGNYVYVDKTPLIYRLITTGEAYFLSRPRRFGKSLTISTLKEIFLGNKALFKGLFIYDKIDWKPCPVIHIDFSEIVKKMLPLPDSINLILDEIAAQHNLTLKQEHYGLRFRELIKLLAQKGRVAILIDEYDKPIIDYLEKEKIPQAIENREILKSFYSVLKANDENIRFLLMTGVSKFSKVSIFSELNHLNDLTTNPNYATLTGYSHDELDHYFADHLKRSAQITGIDNLKQHVSDWYNGYSWDGKSFMFNPFSILNFFENHKFDNYWFHTGTPTFLIKLIKERSYNVSWLEGIEVPGSVFNQYEIESLEITALLMQTGYLTIKKYDYNTRLYTLQYPNNEVRQSFNDHLLRMLSENPLDQNAVLINNMYKSFLSNDMEKFINLCKVMYKNISYPIIDDKENYYHSIFYTMLKLLGYNIETEILTADGRIDAVIKTQNHIFIIEFKLSTPEEALAQIKKKEYALKYASDPRKKILLGIGFDTEQKNIGGFLAEEFSALG